jgi:hypothetical protein
LEAVTASLGARDVVTRLFAGSHSSDAADETQWYIGWDDFGIWVDGTFIQSDLGVVWVNVIGSKSDFCILFVFVGVDHCIGFVVGSDVSW